MREYTFFQEISFRKKIMTIIIICCIAAFLIMLEQWIQWPGHWFDLSEVLHHENFALFSLFFALGIFVAWQILKEK